MPLQDSRARLNDALSQRSVSIKKLSGAAAPAFPWIGSIPAMRASLPFHLQRIFLTDTRLENILRSLV